MLASLDIETVCGVEDCSGYGKVKKCDYGEKHALHHKLNKITDIGIVYKDDYGNKIKKHFTTIEDFNQFVDSVSTPLRLFGQNFKFDFKTLVSKGANITLDNYFGCTKLAAVAYTHKIPASFLEAYDILRKKQNKLEGKAIHREAGRYSLKTMAPYFLGVKPFWEKEIHSDVEYVLKDADYTYDLFFYLISELEKEGTLNFYQEKLVKWEKMLINAELKGVCIDLGVIDEKEKECLAEKEELKNKLDVMWKDAYKAHYYKVLGEAKNAYKEKLSKAIDKLNPEDPKFSEKKKKKSKQYSNLFLKKARTISKDFNFNSPAQMVWLLKDYLKYDISHEVRDKDTNRVEKKDSTGKEVLERLILEGKEDIAVYKEFRKKEKLLSSYFPSYRRKIVDGKLYCNFNLEGTRTGRLSSDNPNLQQVPGYLKQAFVARPGKLLATYDQESLEPHIIAYHSEDMNLSNLLISGINFHNDATKYLVEHVTCDVSEVKAKYKKERDMAKQCDLSLFYGSGANNLQNTAKKHGFHWDKTECRRKLKMFKGRYSGVFRFKEALDALLIDSPVENVMGRKYRIEDPSEIYMKGFNTLIQSGGSDIVSESGARINQEFADKGIDGEVLLLVHDELVVEIPQDRKEECIEIIERNMTNYKLPTVHGDIRLKVEGAVDGYWKK
jgi:DNA polymerase I-like protein with 3'-5' exonuclease and polymerase domains